MEESSMVTDEILFSEPFVPFSLLLPGKSNAVRFSDPQILDLESTIRQWRTFQECFNFEPDYLIRFTVSNT